jgi:hypothetical protein
VDVRVGEGRQQHATREIDDARVRADERRDAGGVADVDDAAVVHRDGSRDASLRVGRVDATAAEYPLRAVAAARDKHRREHGDSQHANPSLARHVLHWARSIAPSQIFAQAPLPFRLQHRARREYEGRKPTPVEGIPMSRKALCIGINDYPGDKSDLNGCVNDANAWASLLRDHYDFASADVKLLLDAQAKKQTILQGLKELLANANPGDLLVFTNSSHGTYVADSSSDEDYDEALCPVDYQSNLIVDDELRELFSNVRDGVNLVVISDSCHSGSVTRLPGDDADERRPRFLSPKLFGGAVLDNPVTASPRNAEAFPESDMKEILLTGCRDIQVSYDARIAGTYHGAMSYHALKAIREAGYDLTYRELHAQTAALVKQARFPQDPQLEGSDANKDRRIFS